MNKRIFLFKFSVLFCFLFLISCKTTKIITDTRDIVYLNYDKVKVHCNINNTKVKFNGYIYQIKDTSICYRFWGPLGFELGRGRIDNTFSFYDAINHNNYPDIKDKMESISGLFLNKPIFFALLSGKTDILANELIALNKGVLKIQEINSDNLQLENEVSRNKINFKFKNQNNGLKTIFIKSTGFRSIFELNIEIVEISYVKKICKF